MATLSLIDMIDEAYERIQYDPRAGFDFRSAKRSLDVLLSDWTNRGLNLWTVEEVQVPLATGTSTVLLGSGYYDIQDAVLRDTSVTPAFDLGLERTSATDFLNIPFKTMRGMPTKFQMIRTFDTTTIQVWMVPDRDYVLVLNMLKIIPELPNYTSAVEIPARFQAALISGLAHQLALKKNPARAQELKMYYEDDFERASAEERDRSSTFIAPELPRP